MNETKFIISKGKSSPSYSEPSLAANDLVHTLPNAGSCELLAVLVILPVMATEHEVVLI